MKAIFLLAIVSAVLAIDVNNQVWTNHHREMLAQIKQTRWGTWILDFAELHMESKGALNELTTAIQELIHDLEVELDDLNHAFDRRTDEHNRDVARLTSELEQAERDVFNTNDFIDNVLYPTRDRLLKVLKQLKDNIQQNRRTLAQETQSRNNDHEAFVARAQEHSEAISAIDECLGLLSGLANPSLVQIKRVKQNLQRINQALKGHSTFAPLIRALVELSTDQNFASQDSLKQIVDAFNSLRNELVDSLNQETADENEAAAEFVVRVQNLDAEHADFQRQTLFRNAELTRTEEKIDSNGVYLAQRKVDRATLQAQLEAENNDYAQESEVHSNLVAQYTKEIGASNQALELLTAPAFQDYCRSKLGF